MAIIFPYKFLFYHKVDLCFSKMCDWDLASVGFFSGIKLILLFSESTAAFNIDNQIGFLTPVIVSCNILQYYSSSFNQMYQPQTFE